MNERRELPYVSNRGFLSVANKAKSIRKKSYLQIFFKKLFNYPLFFIAYWAPLNSIRVYCNKLRGVNIGKNVFIGLHCTIDFAYPEYVYLNDDSSLTGKIYLLAHNRPHEYFKGKLESYVAPVIIGNNATLAIRATVLPGTEIGEGAVVSAGSVVFNDVPADVVVRGNPAEIIFDFNQKDSKSNTRDSGTFTVSELETRLLEIAEKTFENTEHIHLDSDKESVAKWDSLGNMNFLLAVENEFGVEFTADEMVSIQSIRDILQIIKNHQ